MAATNEFVTVSVAEGFRRWAEVYDDSPNPLLALEERLLLPGFANVASRTIVDVGCGTGRWLRQLTGRGATLIGIDASAEMLARAANKVAAGVTLRCADSNAMPIHSGSADLVLCSFTLGYVEDVAALARELRRVIKTGGEVIVSDFHPEAHRRGWRRAFRCGEQQVEIKNFARPIRFLVDAFERGGLTLDECVEPAFGEPERALFVRAGKENVFEEAAASPAIFVLRFRAAASHAALRKEQSITLSGARIAKDAYTAEQADVSLDRGLIQACPQPNAVDLTGYLLLPGLINAHDHLEFNLFPRLGKGPYANFLEWADDIHRSDADAIAVQRSVEKTSRLYWGALKNLFSGVTTVAHHNPYEEQVFATGDFPVSVVQRFGWAHSIELEPDVRRAFAATPPGAPFIVHLGEGTDAQSARALDQLSEWGMLGANTVIVHGVALANDQRDLLRARGAALVWCPTSNLFTLGRTLSVEEVNACGRVALGSDSAISGEGDLLDEIRAARSLGISDERIYEMVTTGAADILRISRGEGQIKADGIADVIAVRGKGLSPAESLCRLTAEDIALVIVGGRVRMISPELAQRWPTPLPDLQELCVAGVRRLVAGPIAGLIEAARRQLGADIFLSHKRVDS